MSNKLEIKTLKTISSHKRFENKIVPLGITASMTLQK